MGGDESQRNHIPKAGKKRKQQELWISDCTVKKKKRKQQDSWILPCTVAKKKRTQQKRFLSTNVLMNILSRCPAKSVLRFKTVSKQWLSLTLDPYFLDMHQDRARNHLPPTFVIFQAIDNSLLGNIPGITTADMNGATFISCCTFFRDGGDTSKKSVNGNCLYLWRTTRPCNGLICLYDEKPGILVYNLATQESLAIRKPDGWGPRHSIIGLGFHPTTKEYKMLSYHGDHDDEIQCNTFRYESLTVGSSKPWRLIGDVNYMCRPTSICVSGILYFIGFRNCVTAMILSLDLFGDEKFREITPPKVKGEYIKPFHAEVYELHGHVCVSFLNNNTGCGGMDLWVLKDPLNHVWTMDYRVVVPKVYTSFNSFVTIYKNKVLLHNCGHFYYSDERQENWNKEYLYSEPGMDCRVDPYVENLLPLKTLQKLELQFGS